MQTFQIKMKWLLLLSFVSAEVPIYSPKEVRIYQKWLVSKFYHPIFSYDRPGKVLKVRQYWTVPYRIIEIL